MKKTRNIKTKNSIEFAGVDTARAARLGAPARPFSKAVKWCVPVLAFAIDLGCTVVMGNKALTNAGPIMAAAMCVCIPLVMDFAPALSGQKINDAALMSDRRTASRQHLMAVLLLVLALAAYAAFAALAYYSMKSTEYAAVVQRLLAQQQAAQQANASAADLAVLQDKSWVNLGNQVVLFVPLLTSLFSFLAFADADVRGTRVRELERVREELEEEYELGEQFARYQQEGLDEFDDDQYDREQLRTADRLYENRQQQMLLDLRFELARAFGAEEAEKLLKAAGIDEKALSAEELEAVQLTPAEPSAQPEEESPEQQAPKAVNFPQ